MPTHRANSKARAVLRKPEKEKAEAVTPFRRTPALHATPLQAMLRQESVTLSRGTPFHSATRHYIHSISPTLQHRATPHAFRYISARHNRLRCQCHFQYKACPAPFASHRQRHKPTLLGSSLKKEADATLFLELALRGYDLSPLCPDTEQPTETAEIVKIS